MATAYLTNVQGNRPTESEQAVFIEERRPSKYGDDVIHYKRGKFLGKVCSIKNKTKHNREDLLNVTSLLNLMNMASR